MADAADPNAAAAAASQAEPLLTVENLEAGYGEVQVLWGVSLKARRGALTAIVGANGAGKTTTLRAVAGSIAPWRGKVTVRGRRRHASAEPRQGGARFCAGAGRPAIVLLDERRRKSRNGRVLQARGEQICRPARPGVHAVPAARRAPAPAGRHAVGRRAADGGDRARADVRSRNSHHRRALARARAGRGLSAVWRR